MDYFLICTNSKCRFLINLRQGAHVLRRSQLVIDQCPECGYPWSGYCPLCGRPLEVDEREIPHRCLHCGRELKPEP
jgi:hypothetical protein